MKKIILGFMTALVVLLPLVSAITSPIDVKEICLNHTTEYANFNYSVSVDGMSEDYGYEQYKDCLNGCSTTLGKCRPDQFRSIIYGGGLVLGMALLGLFIFYVGKNYALFMILVLFVVGITIVGTDVFNGNMRIMIVAADVALIGLAINTALKPPEVDDLD